MWHDDDAGIRSKALKRVVNRGLQIMDRPHSCLLRQRIRQIRIKPDIRVFQYHGDRGRFMSAQFEFAMDP